MVRAEDSTPAQESYHAERGRTPRPPPTPPLVLVSSLQLQQVLRELQQTNKLLARLRAAIIEPSISAPTRKFFFVNATAVGNTEVVERVEGKKIRVVSYTLNNGGTAVATVHFRSGSRPISSTKDLAADGGGMVASKANGFWFETAVGEPLNINLLAAGTVGVDVEYVEVEDRSF